MSSRAKILFLPKLGTTDYAMNHVTLVEKYNGWSYNTSDYKEDGYIYTDTKTSIDEVNSNYWVRFKPDSGYKFQSVHKSTSGGSNQGEYDIEADGSCVVRPWQSGTASIVNNYVMFEVVESADVRYTVSSDLTNCTSDNEPDYLEGTEVTINLTCDTSYIFNDTPVVKMNDIEIPFVVSDDLNTATVTFVITGNCTLSGEVIHTPYDLTLDLTHCTCNYKYTIPSGRVTIVLTADTGYVFSGVVRYETKGVTHVTDTYTQDNTVCSIGLDVSDNVSIEALCTKKVEQISSFTNLYRVTNDILTSLSKVRFASSSETTVDYGSFINNLIKLPFEVPDEMIGDNANIQLGNYDSRVQAELLQNYVLCVNIGHITVNEKYKNVYDYKDTNCILHLPYSENMVLQTEYVVGHVISIEYRIDLYSGNCTVNVISDFTNEIIESKTFNIAKKIPFIQEQNNTVVSTLENVVDNGVKTAFIEVVRNIPYTVNTLFGSETVDYGTLENYAGYIKVSDIMLNISATNDEKNEIETLLKNGVFINENVL